MNKNEKSKIKILKIIIAVIGLVLMILYFALERNQIVSKLLMGL